MFKRKSGNKCLLIKVIALMLSVVLMMPTIPAMAEDTNETYAYGDVNMDGNIDAKDALDVLKHAAKITLLADEQKIYADVSDDGNIDAVDALLILKYAAKIIDKFPVEDKEPEETPTAEPTATPTAEPTATPTAEPTATPTVEPTATPTATPTVEPTATPTPEPTATPTVEPTATPTPEPTPDPNLNPITYDAETNTYTMHGQHNWEVANNDATRNQSNAEYKIANPFVGLDFSEEYTKDEEGMPIWTKGATISMWVYLPETAFDAEILTFKLENYRQCHKDDYVKYLTCQAYSAEDESYSMGTSEIYVAKNEDGTETEYTVLSGYGSNVRYNPEYPAAGLYKLDAEKGTIDVIKKGADVNVEANWTKISNIGTGYYEGYSKRFEEEGGENSKIREANIKGSLNIYASGTIAWQQDDQKSLQINPNADKYGEACAMFNPSFFYHANGISQHWAPNTIFKETSAIPPVLEKKGEWHFYVVTIMNDWIQVYQDGVKLEQNKYINMNGAWLNPSVLRKSLKEFNLGYGYRNLWNTNSPSLPNSFGMLLTDYISYDTTELYVGGYGVAAERAGINHIGTPDGVQIKDIKFYATPAADENVLADGLKDMEEIL